MTTFGGFAVPGQGAAVFTSEREIVAAGFDSRQGIFTSTILSGVARDAGNSPTFVIRPGLLLGTITASSKLTQWDSTASDGSQNITAVNWKELRMQDFDGNNADRDFTVPVGRLYLRAAQLLIKGVALVGHADEYVARRQLDAAHFTLDDDPFGYLAGKGFRQVSVAADTTLTASQNGSLIYATAAAVITLPAIRPGLIFEVINTADAAVGVASAEGTNIVTDNNASASSVTGSTSSHKIGWHARFRSNAAGTKWIYERLSPLAVLDTVA